MWIISKYICLKIIFQKKTQGQYSKANICLKDKDVTFRIYFLKIKPSLEELQMRNREYCVHLFMTKLKYFRSSKNRLTTHTRN